MAAIQPKDGQQPSPAQNSTEEKKTTATIMEL